MAAWWPFGRRQRDAPSTADDRRSAPDVHAAASPAVEATPPTNAWRDLPPLHPSATAIELTAPVQRLADTMTSKRHTGVTDDEMGHSRTVDGPAGTVVGLLKPRVAMHRERTESGPLIFAAPAPEPVAGASAVALRRAQRQALAPTDHLPPPVVEPAVSVESLAPPSSLAPPPSDVRPAGSATLTPPVVGAQRRPAASAELPSVAVRPLPARERVVPAVPADESVALPVVGAVAPIAPATDGPPSPSPLVESEVPRATQRSPLVGTTRIVRRVGEPLRERPASMVSTTEASAGRMTPPTPLAIPPGIARLPDDVPAMPQPSRPRPGMVPARVARRVASIDTAAGDAPNDRGTQRGAASPVPLPTRPLVGSRPSIQRLADAPAVAPVLRAEPTGEEPVTDHDPVPVRWGPVREPRVQRAPEGVPADLRTELEPVLGTPLADVKVHRDTDTGEAARQLSAKAFTAGGEVFLPDWHGSTSSGEARSILTHELTHVAQQRRLGAALPDEASPAGAVLESEARSVADQGPPVPTRPVAPGPSVSTPQRLPGESPSRSLRAVPQRQPERSSQPAAGGMSPMDVVARVQAAASAAGIATPPPSVADAGHAGAPPPAPVPASDRASVAAPSSIVQRLPGDIEDGRSTTSPTSSNTVTTNPTPPDDPAQLDELARRLYPRFRTRLRQDLLADRERSGRLFDVR